MAKIWVRIAAASIPPIAQITNCGTKSGDINPTDESRLSQKAPADAPMTSIGKKMPPCAPLP